jgi:hypothetical protein
MSETESEGEGNDPIEYKNADLNLENDSSDSESEEYVLKPTKSKKKQTATANLSEDLPSVDDAIMEFYKLKEMFESGINKNKKTIINNPTLSNREKRSEFLKLMPKCVNCKRPSKKGTIFSITYHQSDDTIAAYRVFKANCGNLVDPCNLNIEVNIGIHRSSNEELNDVRNEIIESKNTIINDKNKLLFGLITTETALANFDDNKTYISDLTSAYENYLDIWNKEVDNPQKKEELDEALVNSYETINVIKGCIRKMNENNDTHFALEAATIYNTTLNPLLNKIRHLKYSENIIFKDDNNNCKLIQNKYKISDTLVTAYQSKLIAYDVGLKATKLKKKPAFVIDTNFKDSEKEITIKIKEPEQVGDIDDDPIIGQGKDGIAWNNPKYQYLWDKLPEKLKTEFKSNIDWMKEFMYKCVNEREKNGIQFNDCRLTTPPNLVVPPREMANGEYDFGVSIYNRVFNALPKNVKSTYLTLYKEDPTTKVKNYSVLEDTMNRHVEKEVGW